MHDNTYSTAEAKARFSEVLRRVREGRTVTVTYQGEPVAEIHPLDRPGGTAARMGRDRTDRRGNGHLRSDATPLAISDGFQLKDIGGVAPVVGSLIAGNDAYRACSGR